MQTASSLIWTQVSKFIPYDVNHYATSAFQTQSLRHDQDVKRDQFLSKL